MLSIVFFFNDTATTEFYTYCTPLSLHDALPICRSQGSRRRPQGPLLVRSNGAEPAFRQARQVSVHGYAARPQICRRRTRGRSEEHTSELQSLMRISYAVFCLQKKTPQHTPTTQHMHIMCIPWNRETGSNN